MIRVDGKPIPPTEWERVIRSHPKVADCAVVAIHHKEKGHLPKAFVVAADAALTENDVLDLVSGKHNSWQTRQKRYKQFRLYYKYRLQVTDFFIAVI